MRKVTYSMGMTLDGYIVGPDGRFDFSDPDPGLFHFITEQFRTVGVHLMGRRLYETMLFWETAALDPDLDEAQRTWADLWNPLPKVVFSRTLTEVRGNATLATGSVAEEIARLRSEPDESEIAIGGAGLAAEAAELGLIDEYRPRVHPVFVGGGIPFFPQTQRRIDLELLDSRRFDTGVTLLCYRTTN